MEKMDSEKVCAHEKVFRAISHGAGIPWICRLCGEEGSDVATFTTGANEYEKLRYKKLSGGFSHGR